VSTERNSDCVTMTAACCPIQTRGSVSPVTRCYVKLALRQQFKLGEVPLPKCGLTLPYA